MEGHQTVQLPSICQRLPTLSTRDIVGKQGNKDVSAIEIARSVVAMEVKAVLRKSAAISRHLVEAMRPRIGCLRGQSVQIGNPQSGLQRVVIRSPDALDFVDKGE